MRIIAGTLGGRIFDSPSGNRTHPMSDKMRGALFNTLGDIENLTVLDAFAGSGALGLEAISRGAVAVMAIDSDKSSADTIRTNAKSLGIDRAVKVIQARISSWLETSTTQKFDIILTDPPYDDVQLSALEKLTDRLKPGGIFALSWPGKQKAPDFEGLELVLQKNYGDSQLLFYK